MSPDPAILVLEHSWRSTQRIVRCIDEISIGGQDDDITVGDVEGPIAIVAWRDGAWRARPCSPGVELDARPLQDETMLQPGQCISYEHVRVRFLLGDPERVLDEDRHMRLTTDGLTGLLNRKFLPRQTQRLQPPTAVLLIDIDWMKRLNDTYGFVVGDGTLCRTAAMLRDHVTWPEYVVRYGGEEFLVVLPGVTVEQARERAERIRAAAEPAHVITVYGGTEYITATLSIGIAMFAGDFAAALREADENLFRAKEQGRNRVVG